MYASTHGVIFANLFINGKAHGVHGFMMQLRDEHGNCMPGVEVGEIGPKIINSHVNIGYARFTHVRVPRFNMFQKVFKVTREGEFIAPPPKVGKIKNMSMMIARVMNVNWAYRDTSAAAVIATRYSCVRKQGFKNTTVTDGAATGENVIMDYKMQQYRVFKCLSIAYMFLWNSHYLMGYMAGVQSRITKGDDTAADLLPELHATCAGLKVITASIACYLASNCIPIMTFTRFYCVPSPSLPASHNQPRCGQPFRGSATSRSAARHVAGKDFCALQGFVISAIVSQSP
jgi:acyl-CoA oxidase